MRIILCFEASFIGAIIGSYLASIFAPSVEDRRQRESIDRQRKLSSIDDIHSWIKEQLTSATLLYFYATERTEDWRSAVLRYEENASVYTHVLALARRLANAEKVEDLLEQLNNNAVDMLTVSQDRLTVEQGDTRKEKLDKNKEKFDQAQEKATRTAQSLYDLLDDEAKRLLHLRHFLQL